MFVILKHQIWLNNTTQCKINITRTKIYSMKIKRKLEEKKIINIDKIVVHWSKEMWITKKISRRNNIEKLVKFLKTKVEI